MALHLYLFIKIELFRFSQQSYFPFQAANYDFYNTLEDSCCGKLEHISLPVFKPSTTDIRPARSLKIERIHKDSQTEIPSGNIGEIASGMANLSLALSLGIIIWL
jgi:protein SMG8